MKCDCGKRAKYLVLIRPSFRRMREKVLRCERCAGRDLAQAPGHITVCDLDGNVITEKNAARVGCFAGRMEN